MCNTPIWVSVHHIYFKEISGEATLCRRGRLTPTALRLPLIVYKFWPLSTPAKKLPDPSGPTAQHAAEAARKFHFADMILAGLYRQQPRLPIWPPLHRSNSFILSLTAPPIRRSNSASCPCPARRHIMHSDGGGVVAPRADQWGAPLRRELNELTR